MKLIKIILKLLVSVIVQILLLPIKVLVFTLNFMEKFFKILKSVSQHLIEQVENETIEVIK